MAQIFKTYFGIFLMFLCIMVLTGMISANLDVSHARSFHEDVVNEIENSRFSPSVIEACRASAFNAGYTKLTCKSIPDTDGKTMVTEITLGYEYTIPFLNMLNNHEIRGYAR